MMQKMTAVNATRGLCLAWLHSGSLSRGISSEVQPSMPCAAAQCRRSLEGKAVIEGIFAADRNRRQSAGTGWSILLAQEEADAERVGSTRLSRVCSRP